MIEFWRRPCARGADPDSRVERCPAFPASRASRPGVSRFWRLTARPAFISLRKPSRKSRNSGLAELALRQRFATHRAERAKNVRRGGKGNREIENLPLLALCGLRFSVSILRSISALSHYLLRSVVGARNVRANVAHASREYVQSAPGSFRPPHVGTFHIRSPPGSICAI